MNRIGRFRPSASTAISIAALVVASTGSAVAASKIGSDEIENDAVQKNHIGKGEVRGSEIQNGSVKRHDLEDEVIADLEAGGTLGAPGQGAQGAQGPQGETGPQGQKGPQGDQGPVGPAGSTLIDPVGNPNVAGTVNNISWARGWDNTGGVAPDEVIGDDDASEDLSPGPDPIPDESSARFWREIDLDEGTYALSGTAVSFPVNNPGPDEAVVARTFLDGTPLPDGGGYAYVDQADDEGGTNFFPAYSTLETVIEVPSGGATLVQRIGSFNGDPLPYADNFRIVEVETQQ